MLEHLPGDLTLQRGRNHIQEIIKLFLEVKVGLGGEHEVPDLILQILSKFHVLHGGIGSVDLLLELLLLPIESLHDHNGGSEDIGVDQGSQ